MVFRACFLLASPYIIPYEDQENMVFSIFFFFHEVITLPLYKPDYLYFLSSSLMMLHLTPVFPLSPSPSPLASLSSPRLFFLAVTLRMAF